MSNQSVALFINVFDVFRLLICVGFPVWRSYKVVDAKKFDQELVLWLTYWVIFAVITKLEDFVWQCVLIFGSFENPRSSIFFFTYQLLKLLFCLWMVHPRYQGSLLIYYQFLNTLASSNEKNYKKKVYTALNKSKIVAQNGINFALRLLIKKK